MTSGQGAEQRIRKQLRRALDAHITSGASKDSASWRKVMDLDAQLKAVRGQAS